MKILELEIRNIRGIRELVLKPDGENIVIYGPNGSGKSAVVDAIDFLLTGKISRLTGKGTKGITLKEYGPHIYSNPSDARVSAKILIPNFKTPIKVSRCLQRPSTLECELPEDNLSVPEELNAIFRYAERVPHVLTRREILKYITAEGSTRAQEVQILLDLSEIQEIRSTLNKVKTQIDKEWYVAKSAVDEAQKTIVATTGIGVYFEDKIIEIVNQKRRILNGSPISTLYPIKENIDRPKLIVDEQKRAITPIEGDINYLFNLLTEENQICIAENDKKLRGLLISIRSNPERIDLLNRLDLLELGVTLIKDDKCPLCGAKWETGELSKKLECDISMAEITKEEKSKIASLSGGILSTIKSASKAIEKINAAVKAMGLSDDYEKLKRWQEDLKLFAEDFIDIYERYPNARFDPDSIKHILAPSDIIEVLNHVKDNIKANLPKITPEQAAWDFLTVLDTNIRDLISANERLESVTLTKKRAELLFENFEKSRDAILNEIYSKISDRFSFLYSQIHSQDESDFKAIISPRGPAVDLEVDFFGEGLHLPHALHSEGHQDSMGICLYLALIEKLESSLINMVILDDVIMSVDADHRRDICKLISGNFSEWQFIITTHDKTWFSELIHDGIVNKSGAVELYDWKLDTGPIINYETDIWNSIYKDIDENNIPVAAFKLRRASEEYFRLVCDSLHAPVVYKLDGKLDLGDLIFPAIGEYGKLLKKATASASSWNNKEILIKLLEMKSVSESIIKRTCADQWQINTNIHYNNWATFSKKEFLPVVQAFEDLFNLFKCCECNSIIFVAESDNKDASLRCKCGKVNLNLLPKK